MKAKMIISKYILIGFCVFAALAIVNGDEKISSKLDLEESKEDDTSKNTNQKNSAKSSPKIQGVRVTVDTSDGKKSKELDSNKESVEVIETKNKKRVGIHTDITFEITDEKDNSNSTGDDDNASVPIFKGRTRPSTHKPKRPYDPKINQWYPLYPEHGRRHHHQQPASVLPIYPRSKDEGIYRSIDSWSNYVPITGVWTTERNYRPPILPPLNLFGYKTQYILPDDNSEYISQYTPPARSDAGLRPCYCSQDDSSSDGSTWIDDSSRGFRATSSIIHIDDKLSSPFSIRK